MAFREVTMIEVKEVLRRWPHGESKSQISRQCGVARATVRRYISAAEESGLSPTEGEAALTEERLGELAARLQPETGRPHGDGWKACATERSFIEKHLEDGVRLTKIRKLLRRKGVLVSYATLWRYASAELGLGGDTGTIPVSEGAPGKEVQIDTGWVGRLLPDVAGHRRRFRAWIFTPVVSRYRFVYPVFEETTETAIEACEAAWEFYGGVFSVVIPDNTKAIVTKADPLKPQFSLGFLEYAQDRGFFIDPTRVASPKDKARVERSVIEVREDCFAGEELLEIVDTRTRGLRWSRDENGVTPHRVTLRPPVEMFELWEREHLLPAPTTPYDMPVWSEPKVHPDQHALVEKSLYSLPPHFVGKYLDARADRTTVRFYQRRVVVKVHPRMQPGERHTDASDFQPDKAALAMRDVDFLVRRAGEYGEAVARFATALLDGPEYWMRMRQVYALLGYGKRYGAARLNDACTIALEVEMVDVYRLRRLLEIAAQRAIPAGDRGRMLPVARFLRPSHQFALQRTSRKENS